jgi:dihydroneopterin aldolase
VERHERSGAVTDPKITGPEPTGEEREPDSGPLPLDSITLTGLRATGHHGVFEHERVEGQEFVIDVTVWLDFAAAAASDALERTIHYGVLAEEVVAAVERDAVDLIETVAERIAAVVLEHQPARRVRVTLHKPSAPITVPFADVAVTITRARP